MRRHRLQHNAEERAAPAGASRHGLGLVADVQVSDHRRMEDRWRAVDAYVEELLGTSDEVLEAALADMVVAGMPAISVSPAQGKFLRLLTRAVGASRVLEVGTLGGYGTIWLGRAVAPDGRVVTLEISLAGCQHTHRAGADAAPASPLSRYGLERLAGSVRSATSRW
jgi:protein-L-isoaspartate O-methyltransferase